MNTLSEILKLFPPHLPALITEAPFIPEEIRIRRGQAMVLRAAKQEFQCNGAVISQSDISYLVTGATNGAFHTVYRSMEQGYIPLPEGCRMGISGEGTGAGIRSTRDISSVCVRIAREIPGCGDELLQCISTPVFQNTIIIAPPGGGKTTLLRELIRKLSCGGYYIAAVDTRGEISGMQNGSRGFDLGPRCDVTVGIPKQQAAMMMLRSMAPDILAMDEITAFSDMDAITEALGCGVGLLATMHGDCLAALNKPGFRKLHEMEAFQVAILIKLQNGTRTYEAVTLHDKRTGHNTDSVWGDTLGDGPCFSQQAAHQSAAGLD